MLIGTTYLEVVIVSILSPAQWKGLQQATKGTVLAVVVHQHMSSNADVDKTLHLPATASMSCSYGLQSWHSQKA